MVHVYSICRVCVYGCGMYVVCVTCGCGVYACGVCVRGVSVSCV